MSREQKTADGGMRPLFFQTLRVSYDDKTLLRHVPALLLHRALLYFYLVLFTKVTHKRVNPSHAN